MFKSCQELLRLRSGTQEGNECECYMYAYKNAIVKMYLMMKVQYLEGTADSGCVLVNTEFQFRQGR
jgi:hypothetical protein